MQAVYNCAVLYQRKGDADNLSTAIQLYERVTNAGELFARRFSSDGESPASEKTSLTGSQSTGIQALQFLARFGSITATAQYLENDVQQRSLKEIAAKWVAAAKTFVDELPTEDEQGEDRTNPLLEDRTNPLLDDRIAKFIALEAHRAFGSLVTCYEDRWPSTKSTGGLDAVSISTLRAAQSSLEFVERRTVPNVALYRNIVQVDKSLNEFEHAKGPACRAIRMGAQDEIFFYTAAAAAQKEGKEVESYRICTGYKGSVAIEEFETMRKKFESSTF
jgi:hypothetical protein